MSELLDYYSKLKSGVQPEQAPVNPIKNPAMYIDAVSDKAAEARHDCHKKILIDIYTRIQPLDQSYVQNNPDVFVKDIDTMLGNKYPNSNEPATMYLKSAAERTKSPLVERMLHCGNKVYSNMMREANEYVKEPNAQFELPTEEEQNYEIKGQIVDLDKDVEYGEFINRLREKTVAKIVNDVSSVIRDEKDKKDMSFNTRGIGESVEESILEASLYFMTKQNYNIPTDMKMALAMREATLNQFDLLFENSDYALANKRAARGQGFIMNESYVQSYVEK